VSQELFDEADRLEDEGQNEQALGIWRQLSEIEPTRNVFLRLGRLARELGLADEAEKAFQRAIKSDPRSWLALTSLGSLAIRRGEYSAAVNYLRLAREIKEDPGSLSILGDALRNTGRDSEAEEAYRSAIQIDPNYEEAYYNLGVLLRHRPAEAQALLRRAIELDPVFAAAHRELGFLLSERAPSTEAEAHLRKALELDPKDGWAHIYLGSCLWRRAAVDAAVAEFRIAQELEPDWSVPLWSLGNIYDYESIDLNMAKSYFERALEQEHDDWNALKGLARVNLKLGNASLAKGFILRALQQHPNHEKSVELLREIDEAADPE